MENTAILKHAAATRDALVLSASCAQTSGPGVPVPAPVDELHGLHGEGRGHNIVGVVPSSSNRHQPVHFPRHEDEPRRSDEAQQARPGEGELADRSTTVGNRKHLQEVKKVRLKGSKEIKNTKTKRLTLTSNMVFVIPGSP